MAWRMSAETTPLDRVWMAFPVDCLSIGADPDATYRAWAAVANEASRFVSVAIVVDPSEHDRAKRLLTANIEQIEAPLDDCWMRDIGPTFVVDDARPGVLGAVDWVFNGWGAQHWSRWDHDQLIGGLVAEHANATLIPSLLVNEGGGIHVDGEGTVLVTQTVQLDPGRNPYANRRLVEQELQRTIGAEKVIWLPRGLHRDYDDLGTRGHVDMVACMPSPGRVLLHQQRNPNHPDHVLHQELRSFFADQTDARGRTFEVVDVPAPEVQRDDEGFVDYSYINHVPVNGGVLACGFGEPAADRRAAAILAEEYPGREIVTIDARPILSRGGGIHCITQQQPSVSTSK
jgi:agmatine deiminase